MAPISEVCPPPSLLPTVYILVVARPGWGKVSTISLAWACTQLRITAIRDVLAHRMGIEPWTSFTHRVKWSEALKAEHSGPFEKC